MRRPRQRLPHAREPHEESFAARLNWLRAGVLGANDGIISIAGLVIGVAAATSNLDEIATAGLAGLVAGAVSMALGEYVSVSAQRDSERALVEQERRELATMPEAERAELEGLLRERGLSATTAASAAAEMTEHDVLRAHTDLELGLDAQRLVNPWAAAGSSALSFTVGALLPFIAILVPPTSARIPVAFAAVVLALVVTGWLSAFLGRAPRGRAIARLVVGGALAMAITFGVGLLFGTAIG
jgi:VIT1/CCC1 family predicted Fe2+/Mn2+ transporter